MAVARAEGDRIARRAVDRQRERAVAVREVDETRRRAVAVLDGVDLTVVVPRGEHERTRRRVAARGVDDPAVDAERDHGRRFVDAVDRRRGGGADELLAVDPDDVLVGVEVSEVELADGLVHVRGQLRRTSLYATVTDEYGAGLGARPAGADV